MASAKLRAQASYEVRLADGSCLWIVEAPGFPGGFKILDYSPEKEFYRVLEHSTKQFPHLRAAGLAPQLQLKGPHYKYEPVENSPITVRLNVCEGDPLIDVYVGMVNTVINLRRARVSSPAPR